MAESESLESLNKPQNHQNDTVKPIEEDVDNDYEQREEQQQVLINEPNEGDESLQSESRNLHVNDRTQVSDLKEVNLAVESGDGAELKDHVEVCHNEVPVDTIAQAAEAHIQSQSQVVLPLVSELSPTSVTQSISSAPSPTLPTKKFSPVKLDIVSDPEAHRQNSPDSKRMSVVHIVKPPVSDGYNWRKYGQKHVKSPKGSRSYYKCTFSECCAKKIECSDLTGHLIEIVNKGMHSHDPPRKSNGIRESSVTPSAVTVTVLPPNNASEQLLRTHNDSDPSTSSKDCIQDNTTSADKKRPAVSELDGSSGNIVEGEQALEPEPKKRVKKDNSACSSPVLKPGKKPKFVVHAAGDVGISGDGYRWRKYGQKMVKGNSNPRNYYRCTSAGCPVRKHIETAVDNTNAVVITYKGVHDHDMPVPKKRHGRPSAPLVAAAAPASMNNLQIKKSDTVQNQTQWSVSTEGELTGAAMDLGGEKAMESARTLLSIGFEIKPC